ncbi:unnamed protein product [Bursaphelenchus okinawaensis]|uniref:Uncharacterized protein n=1 Tax=Bursaphelenchus okinawaensis TaxID=465554 RepID=A0A811K0Q9_9BILA|nr:unnamed protein product [Bursaphelenchus okinawaensis]CAG9089404.1 unnamed protein product [Bursaphelenchus okinawaensis]
MKPLKLDTDCTNQSSEVFMTEVSPLPIPPNYNENQPSTSFSIHRDVNMVSPGAATNIVATTCVNVQPLDTATLYQSQLNYQAQMAQNLSIPAQPNLLSNLTNFPNQTVPNTADSPLWDQWMCMLAKNLTLPQWHAYWHAYVALFGVNALPTKLSFFNDFLWMDSLQINQNLFGNIVEIQRFCEF